MVCVVTFCHINDKMSACGVSVLSYVLRHFKEPIVIPSDLPLASQVPDSRLRTARERTTVLETRDLRLRVPKLTAKFLLRLHAEDVSPDENGWRLRPVHGLSTYTNCML